MILTLAAGFCNSLEEVVIVAPAMENEGRKASTVIVSAVEGIVNGEPTGTT